MPYPYHYDNEHKPDEKFDLPTLHQLVQSFKDFVRELLEERKTDAKD